MPDLSRDELAWQVESLRWYHTIDLGHGLITHGIDDTPKKLLRVHMPASLQGKTVLDIGAWDGFFSFEAERRGASRVLATDWFTWKGMGWGSKKGFELAREVFHSRVEDQEISVHDISPATVGEFDVVLFLGVLYHLEDPFAAIRSVASVTRELLILETEVDLLFTRRPAMAFYAGTEMNADPTNWWAPNLSGLIAMLRVVGFPAVRCVYKHSFARRLGFAFLEMTKGRGFLRTLARSRVVVHASK